ncbi:hypothetical protein KU306_12155 [Haloferax larsenii]|uniref:Uncharacterized protein n=1 Tax=Haloferax larsenii TaxID=302484 RepID=A0ABY5RBG6_HALLR|nr:hypothetical protein [Haloferax larsenii]UVE49657.1 hypothetical protein KU306_12155 [Haloferax larsenii]
MSSEINWAASDLRSQLRKRYIEEESGAVPEAVLADRERLVDLMVRLVRDYNADEHPDLPDDVRDSVMFKKLHDRMESHRGYDAVRTGDLTTMRHMAGSTGDDGIDMADWKQYEILKDLWRQEPVYDKDFTNSIFQAIIFSNNIPPTGRGKSDWMYSNIQFGLLEYPDARVITNNTSDPFEDTPEQWDDLEHEIKNHDGWMILGIDEAAQFLQYDDQSGGKTISQRLKLLRHNRCHIILVAHTGIDIPADIRRQVFVMNKLDKQTAQLGYGIKPMANDDRMEVANELYRFNTIPATDINYDDIDDEGIEIKFDGSSSTSNEDRNQPTAEESNAGEKPKTDAERKDVVIEYLTTDQSMSDMGEKYGVSKSTVSDWVEKFSRGDD